MIKLHVIGSRYRTLSTRECSTRAAPRASYVPRLIVNQILCNFVFHDEPEVTLFHYCTASIVLGPSCLWVCCYTLSKTNQFGVGKYLAHRFEPKLNMTRYKTIDAFPPRASNTVKLALLEAPMVRFLKSSPNGKKILRLQLNRTRPVLTRGGGGWLPRHESILLVLHWRFGGSCCRPGLW